MADEAVNTTPLGEVVDPQVEQLPTGKKTLSQLQSESFDHLEEAAPEIKVSRAASLDTIAEDISKEHEYKQTKSLKPTRSKPEPVEEQVVDEEVYAAEQEVEQEEEAPKSEISYEEFLAQTVTAKINGKESEISIKDLRDAYQLKQASAQEMTRARRMEQDIGNLINHLGTDPFSILEHKHGVEKTFRLAEAYVLDGYNLAAMSDEDREKELAYRKTYAENTTFKHQITENTKQAEQAETAKLTDHYTKTLHDELDAVGLPHDTSIIQEMRRLLLIDVEEGNPPDFAVAADKIVAALNKWEESQFNNISPEQLAERLSDAQLDKIRQVRLNRVRPESQPARVLTNKQPPKRGKSLREMEREIMF